MSDKSMKLEQAMFILRHGSAEGEHKYFEVISVIEKAYNRLKAENKNCGVKIQNQREQLKACNEKIKEQQAEIKRLTEENKILSLNADTAFQDGLNEAQELYAEQIRNEVKCEAYKEFAKRLLRKATIMRDEPQTNGVVRVGHIYETLEEMWCGE